MKIKFSLDPASIDSAIEQLEQYCETLEKATSKSVQDLTEQGAEFAKDAATFMGAYDSGRLVDGIVAQMDSPTKGRVVSTAPHSAFVEMGTGIVGKQNPSPDENIPWQYDVNEHGEKGWYYYKNGERHWTKGMPSRPFMFETAQELRLRMPKVFRDNLKGDNAE